MSLFKRSVVSEIINNMGVVFSTLIIVWLSVLLVRLLGQAAEGQIGADLVIGVAALSSITALPTILAVSLFVAVITTVSRNYRESEMVVWFASGLSLTDWIKPILRVAVPITLLIALLTLNWSPWAYRQIEEYKQRYAQRSDLSKVTSGQFLETSNGDKVLFAEPAKNNADTLGFVFARLIDPQWYSILTTHSARIVDKPNGDRILILNDGYRYDLKPGQTQMRVAKFDDYSIKIQNKSGTNVDEQAKAIAFAQLKGRPSVNLVSDNTSESMAQLMWRVSLPIAALLLAVLAIPLGAVNPRMGRSGDLVLAGLIGMLYMNMINLMSGWIRVQKVGFLPGTMIIHIVVLFVIAYFFWSRIRVRKPKDPSVVNP